MQSANKNGMQATHKKAIILCVTGALGSLGLISFKVIKDDAFVDLIYLFFITSMFILFSEIIESVNFKTGMVKFKNQLSSIDVYLAKAGISFEAVLPKFVSVEPDTITDETINTVIKVIGETEYAWRHIDDISHDSGFSIESTKNKIAGLIEHGYVVETEKYSQKVYGLSSKGQTEFHKITT